MSPTRLFSLLVVFSLLLSTQLVNAQSEQTMNVISDQEFRDLRTTPGKLDQVLTNNYPEWANYTQMVPWSTQPVKLGEIIVSVSHDEESNLQINAAVTLVTLGDSLNWQLPSNTDIYLRSQEISTELNRLSFDWENPFDDSLRRQYPEVANSGTYALYAFFDYNLDRLQSWQQTYRGLFGEGLLQTTSADADLLEATGLEPFLALPFEHPETKFWTLNAFFDHQSPLYGDDTAPNILYRFDGELIQKDVPNGIYVSLEECDQTLTGATCYSGHDGIDYDLDYDPDSGGEPVLAAAAGTVIAWDKGSGTVTIQHANGLLTIYMHMSAVYVDPDDSTKNTVDQGDVIGEAGEEGNATGPHLHFGVRQPDNPKKDIDPFGWWSLDPDPWSTYPTYGQTSTWLWKGDEVGDGYLTVDNRESQAQFFLPPSSNPPESPQIGWHRLTTGYDGEAWYSFMHRLTDDLHKYWAIWGSTIEQPGEYVVQAYWPNDPDPNDEWLPASNAQYILYFHENGVLRKETLYGNQIVGANQFNPLCKIELGAGDCPADQIARFTFDQGATTLILSNQAGYDESQHRRILFFDAIRWQEYTAPPTSTPVPTTPAPASNYALRFQSTSFSQGIMMPTATALDFSGDMTIEFWIRTTSAYGGGAWHDAQWILDKDMPWGGNPDWAVVAYNGHIVFNNGNPGGNDQPLQSVQAVNNGSWHHVAITRNTSTGNGLTTIYIDGVQDTSGLFSIASIGNPFALTVGVEGGPGSLNPRAFRGDLDDLRLWNIARSQAEIQEKMNVRLQGNETGLAGYWNFDEGEGQIVGDGSPYHTNGQLGSYPSSDDGDPEWILASEIFTGTPPTPVPVTPGPTITPIPTNPPLPWYCDICDVGCPANSTQQLSNSVELLGTPDPQASASESAPLVLQAGESLNITDTATLLYRVRDEILSTTPEGQRLADLYYTYIPNIIQVLIENPEVSDQSMEVLDLFIPSLQALVDGDGDTVTITSEQVNGLQSFLDALVENGDPERLWCINPKIDTSHPSVESS
jgi:murein DD-endopeptidase MepM/ murein hydrolase activator NlpD